MKVQPRLDVTPNVAEEIRRLARFQGIVMDEVEQVLSAFGDHNLDTYAEVVITERGLELITGGVGSVAAELASIARHFGAPEDTARTFLDCAAAFPERMLGLKVCLGPEAAPPTLYVRTMCSTNEGLVWLQGRVSTAALVEALADNRTLYGLGFASREGECAIKTYSLGPLPDDTIGFHSWRATSSGVVKERKRYWPDVPWGELPLTSWRWRRLARFAARELGYDVAGHFATTERDNEPDELKLYVERIGAIATDRSAQ
ncbi:MAG: hypothetical protein R3B72_32700 [Polyangiaceae bacterium]